MLVSSPLFKIMYAPIIIIKATKEYKNLIFFIFYSNGWFDYVCFPICHQIINRYPPTWTWGFYNTHKPYAMVHKGETACTGRPGGAHRRGTRYDSKPGRAHGRTTWAHGTTGRVRQTERMADELGTWWNKPATANRVECQQMGSMVEAAKQAVCAQ